MLTAALSRSRDDYNAGSILGLCNVVSRRSTLMFFDLRPGSPVFNPGSRLLQLIEEEREIERVLERGCVQFERKPSLVFTLKLLLHFGVCSVTVCFIIS